MTPRGQAFREAVYRVTSLIPRGRVATYAQVATYVVSPRHARAVGNALKELPPERVDRVPWQRVINSAGRISARGEVHRPILQEKLLRKEGVEFDRYGRVDLAIHGWAGPEPDGDFPLEGLDLDGGPRAPAGPIPVGAVPSRCGAKGRRGR